MPNELENLQINRLIAHEIKKEPYSNNKEVVYSSRTLALSPIALNELQLRVTEATGNDSHAIQMKITEVERGSVYNYIYPFLIGTPETDDFINISKALAKKLSDAQSSHFTPGGVFFAFDGTTGFPARRCFGIIKADKLSGFSVSNAEDTPTIIFLNDLLLTPQQKMYKVALFIGVEIGSEASLSPEDTSVIVFDNNSAASSVKTAATYFYSTFLGCTYMPNADVQTRDFFNYTKEFVQKKAHLCGEEQVKIISSLHTYLNECNSATINVQEFASRHFPNGALQDAYKAYMRNSGVSSRDIMRDTSLIAGKLKKRRIAFSNSMMLSIPAEEFSNIEFLPSEAGCTVLKIKGTVQTEK